MKAHPHPTIHTLYLVWGASAHAPESFGPSIGYTLNPKPFRLYVDLAPRTWPPDAAFNAAAFAFLRPRRGSPMLLCIVMSPPNDRKDAALIMRGMLGN